MNAPARTAGVAVVCDRQGNHAAAVQDYLQAQGVPEAAWYLPRDVDELDRALRAGHVRRIIFPNMREFLSALWDEPLRPECWLAPDTCVEFVEPSGPTDAARAAAIIASWRRSRQRRRRARAVAGLILSAVALVAAFVLVALAKAM